MLRSRAVAKENPPYSCNTVLVFGIGKGFLTNLLFTSWKSLRSKWCYSYLVLWIMAKPIQMLAVALKPPVYITSPPLWWWCLCVFWVLRKLDRDRVYTPSLNRKETSLVFQSPKVPSKSNSYFLLSCSNFLFGLYLHACNSLWQLTEVLLCCILHLESELHIWLHPVCSVALWLSYC